MAKPLFHNTQEISVNSANDLWHCLSQVKVLDLTNEMGYMCGKMLADMGADVIKIEWPEEKGKSKESSIYQQIYDQENELYSQMYNAGKRSITINLDCEDGRGLFKKLIARTDIILESYPPGKMEDWGLDYQDLSAINSSLIYTSITPFGRSGPYRHNKITDLVAMAMGGPLFLTGDDDRPPVQTGYPQAYLHAGAEACVATMMALYHRETTGEGQLVDVSIQESLMATTFNTFFTWITNHAVIPRMGSSRMVGIYLNMPLVWPCKDGFVNFTVLGGPSGGKTMRNLANWMEEEGMGDETISSTDWGSLDFYGLTTEMVEKVIKPLDLFFSKYNREELFSESIKRGIMLFPVVSADDILTDPHLDEKGFWQQLEQSGIEGRILFPRSPIRINDEYLPLRSKAPHVGEHNEEVLRELLGISEQEFNELVKKEVL